MVLSPDLFILTRDRDAIVGPGLFSSKVLLRFTRKVAIQRSLLQEIPKTENLTSRKTECNLIVGH